jgi:hypothetical protein
MAPRHGWPVFLLFGLCTAVFTAELWPSLFGGKSPPVDDFLQQFPGPVELKVSSPKFLSLAVGLAVFGSVSLWAVLHEPFGWFATAILRFCAIACAVGIPLSIVLMVRGATLQLDGQGLQFRHGWQTRCTRWADSSIFEVATLPPANWALIAYDDAASKSTMGSLNASITGRSSALPETYGLYPKELAQLLNQWRERALAARGS